MQLQPDEQTILSTNDDIVVLTTRRISGTFKDWGHAHTTFIYLEDISSIQTIYRSNIILVGLSVLCGVFALFSLSKTGAIEGSFVASLAIGIILLIYWWFTQRRMIIVYPNGGKPLEIAVNDMNEAQINDFLEKLQLAKTQRIHELYK
jgi:hypothetical protein